MGYPVYTKSLVCYIEANIMNGKLDYNELEKNIGYSKSYIREIFRNDMGRPLAEYIRERRIKCSAMDLVNSDKTIIEIAYKYGFANPETYTRAFYKIAGVTPSIFRKKRLIAGKERIFPDVYSIGMPIKKRRGVILIWKSIFQEAVTVLFYMVSLKYIMVHMEGQHHIQYVLRHVQNIWVTAWNTILQWYHAGQLSGLSGIPKTGI